MLEFTLQQFPLRFGLDEGTDPNQQPPGRLVTAENAEWVKGGRIQKRDGVSLYADAGVVSAGKRLLSRGSELCITDGSYLYARSTSRNEWEVIDRVPDVAMTWTTALDPPESVSCSDVALSSGGHLVQVWRVGAPGTATAKLWVRVLDIEGGTQLLSPVLLSTTAVLGCRVVISGTNAFVVWHESTNILAQRIDLSTVVSASAVQTLRTDATSASGFDALIVGSNLVICYENGVSALKLYSYSYAPNTYTQTATGGITGEAGNGFAKIAIAGITGERIYVAYHVSSTALVRVATANDSTMAQVTAPVTLDSTASLVCYNVTVLRQSASNAIVGWSFENTVTAGLVGRFTTCQISTTCVVTSGSTRGTWGTRACSRLFLIGTRCFAFVIDHPGSFLSPYVGINSSLVEIETTESLASNYVPHRYVGKLDLLVGAVTDPGFLPSAASVSSTDALVPVPFLSATPQTNANWKCGVRHARVVIGASLPSDMWRSCSFSGESYISGGLFSAYDGRIVFDYGIARPPIIGSQSNSGPGGNLSSGTYIYGYHEDWKSFAGVLHRSATSTTTQSSAATSQTTIWLLTSALTAKLGSSGYSSLLATPVSPSQYIAHRSTVNGLSYHRLTFEPGYQVTIKGWQASNQTLTDNAGDSNIGSSVALASRPIMYTAGDVLDDYQPPNLITHTLHKSRIWGVAGDQRTIWFSKSFQDDLGVAPGFSPSFRFTMEEDITALWSMDEKLVAASDRGLWLLVGGDAGPAPNGDGSDIQGPLEIQSDVGCTNPRSVVGMPDGTMFESDGRIYLLSRGLEVVWIGRPVQDQLASFPSITSAVLVPKKNQVRFTCNNSGATAHTVLVYNYVEKQWSTFRYLEGSMAIADATLHDGAYHFLTTGGDVYQESSAASHKDDGEWVTLTLESAWISAAGPLAFQSVRRLALHGTSHSDHALFLYLGFDRSASYGQSASWVQGSDVTTVGPLEAAEVHVGKLRKCSSIRFKIQDAAGGSDGQGPSFDSMGIEVGIKKGFEKKPATKRG